MSIQALLEKASSMVGNEIELEGLMRKSGRIKQNSGTDSSDVLGFDCIVYFDNACYEFYAANPPLKGMTQPMPIMCPLGIEIVKDYKIDYKEAIEIFHKGKWGSHFVYISLCKPMVYPQATEPYWYFVSNLGVNVVIGADTGDVIAP